ncbi:uncharacterized protein LOC135082225 isoform X1 [Ostrinia nubilalis]|uniref:uncharacterized protein LOC135082225 isoform X1 n=1 Tax=Ostrinia nubilalis TaxID=29057 RepID=UPI0030823AB6
MRAAGRPRQGSLSALGTDRRLPVFASSLLSLISPWDRSRAARLTRSPARCPRPVAPPPPPRRHSDPSAPATDPPTTRVPPHTPHKLELDLRQELLNTNDNIEFDSWLGCNFDQDTEQHHRFEHDIPLQRSVSLDRGVDVFNYLQTIGSDWSGSSIGSTWTVHSFGQGIERYRSVEDVPASQIRVKSRRASSDFDGAFGRSLALSVLRDSYRGIDMGSGSLSPQIKKLKWTYSVTDSFEDFADSKVDDLRTTKDAFLRTKRPYCRSCSVESSKSNASSDFEGYVSSGRQSPQIKKLKKNVSLRNLIQVKRATFDLKSDSEDSEIEAFTPYFKDISIKTRKTKELSDKGLETKNLPTLVKHLKSFSLRKNLAETSEGSESSKLKMNEMSDRKRLLHRSMSIDAEKTNVKSEAECGCMDGHQKRIGMTRHMSFVGVKKMETNLRKEVLIKQNMSYLHSSCEDILARSHKKTRRRSIESNADSGFPSMKHTSKIEVRSNIQLPKKDVTTTKGPPSNQVVSINATDENRFQATGVAKCENINPTNTSNLVEISRICDCRICTEDEREDRKSLIRRMLNKLFMKIISGRDYGRKLTYWDENNNLNESEMYTCIMHILKLMLGLWLRHLDHN